MQCASSDARGPTVDRVKECRGLKHEAGNCPGDWFSCLKQNITNLSSCVDNFRRKVLTLVPDLFAEGVFDGRIVAFDEVTVDVSDSERGFAC